MEGKELPQQLVEDEPQLQLPQPLPQSPPPPSRTWPPQQQPQQQQQQQQRQQLRPTPLPPSPPPLPAKRKEISGDWMSTDGKWMAHRGIALSRRLYWRTCEWASRKRARIIRGIGEGARAEESGEHCGRKRRRRPKRERWKEKQTIITTGWSRL